MMTKQELENAVFWDDFLCPSCETIEEESTCSNCGEECIPAATALKILSMIEPDGLEF